MSLMKRHFRSLLVRPFCIFLFVLICHTPVIAAEESPESKTRTEKQKSGFNLGAAFVSIFKNHISAVDGDRCPSLPTCSSYSVQAFKKHGFFIGWMMTFDRLLRCGRDELRLSPGVMENGEIKCYDPLENNDFWWYNGR